MVASPDDADLAEMMAAMGEVESAPLVDTERAEDHVADGTARAEDGFSPGEELVHLGEAGGGLPG